MIDPRLKEFITDEYSKRIGMSPKKRNIQIIQIVKDKFGRVINKSTIYDIGKRNKEKMKENIDAINESVKNKKPPYEVVDGEYILHRRDEAPFKFSIAEIDEMFLDFSEKGNNLTGEEMIQKYELKPEAWSLIKNRLRLYKKSNVISPYTYENISEEEAEEKIEFAISRHIDTMRGKMVKTYDKTFKSEAKKAFKTLGNIDYFLENIRESVKDHKPIEITYTKKPRYNSERIDIAFSDIHIGKKNTDAIVKRIDEIFNFIVSRPEQEVNIFCLGDLGESFAPGGMHEGQTEHMEMHGFDLMMFIVEVFEQFLIGLEREGKRVTFRGIGGNHDRIGKHHNEDMQRTAALAIYEMIKRGISNTDIEFSYFTEKINTFSIGNIAYCIHHGDQGFDKRRMEDILWKNGMANMYNVILHGDKHNGKFQETKRATMVQVPMLAGKGEYDTMLDLHSEPGFVVIEENAFKTADITFKRLP